jgi:beta-lactamase regulating signal transducer with metallopeptidase domain
MDALIELYWKSSLLLAAGGVAALLARRASAATRHLIWTAALVGALALPFASKLLPRVTVATLPPQPIEVFEAPREIQELPDFTLTRMQPQISHVVAPKQHQRWLGRALKIDWQQVALLSWGWVTLALLVRIMVGELQLRRIARRAQQTADAAWLMLLHKCGAAPEVMLLISKDVEVPITWGTLHPRIVVPESAAGWSAEHKRAVLLHELAHVERRDALTQFIARIACAMHWPNPLAWFAAAAMRKERECACDDRVLAEGARPTDYATSLLEVARAADHGGGNSALAMARRGQLEGRLLAVLDPTVNRRPAGRAKTIAVAIAAAVVAIPLATVRAERMAADTFALVSPLPLVPASESPLPATTAVAKRSKAKRLAQMSPPSPPSPPSPASPPSPSSPASPSSPSSPSSMHGNLHISNQDGSSQWTSSWSDGDRSSTFIIHGKVQWNDEMTDVVSLSRDGSFELTVRDGSHHSHAEIFPSKSGLTRSLIVDGAPQAWDEQWFARTLDDLDRHSGFAAEVRFPKLYADGGAKAVLARVNGMDGDYGRSRYLQLLVARDPLDEPTATAVFATVAKMSGDYERSQVLKAAAAKAHLDTDQKRAAFFAACQGIKGNYERSQVLHQLIDEQKLSPGLTHEVLAFIGKMDGDYEKSQLLIAILKHPIDPLELLKSINMSGNYEHSQVLKSLIAVRKLDGPAQLEVIRQARDLGDYESAQVLVSLTESMRLTDDARTAYEHAAERLGDYSRKRVLAALEK